MSWRIVARRDALDPYRSRSLFAHLAVFVLVFGLLTYVAAGPDRPLATYHVSTVALFLPLVALLVGYKSIAEPRENGGLRVVLSFPHTRREVLLGTVVGRAAVVAALTTVGFLASTVVYLVEIGVPDLGSLAVGWLFAVLLGVAMVALAVGISASVRTTNRAVVAVFGTFLLLAMLWGQIPTLVRFVANGFAMPTGPGPEWVTAFRQLNPTTAYQTAVNGLVTPVPTPDAVYYQPWFGVLVLLGWTVVPLLVGLQRFENSDL
ncbi:ABC transporter permease subunit [Halomicrobium salinisoli]|uniref:ABC transporter permease subunit n=1 Tax=Halomicrobium salinisoli TaxID=2878391 RepID=UPI001CF04173|nr:ABC transporter permease subunit [Halomicrobium salinisoli]